MRFHCPKCDTKYRITEDKLAERPTAKMRCKECATVFSVQEAIAAEGQRASEVSTPGDEGHRVSPSSLPPSSGGSLLPSTQPSLSHASSNPPSPPASLGLATAGPGLGNPGRLPTSVSASRLSDRPPAPGAARTRDSALPTRPLRAPGADLLPPKAPLSTASAPTSPTSLGVKASPSSTLAGLGARSAGLPGSLGPRPSASNLGARSAAVAGPSSTASALGTSRSPATQPAFKRALGPNTAAAPRLSAATGASLGARRGETPSGLAASSVPLSSSSKAPLQTSVAPGVAAGAPDTGAITGSEHTGVDPQPLAAGPEPLVGSALAQPPSLSEAETNQGHAEARRVFSDAHESSDDETRQSSSHDDAPLAGDASETQSLDAPASGAVEPSSLERGSFEASAVASGPWSSNVNARAESDTLETPLVPPPASGAHGFEALGATSAAPPVAAAPQHEPDEDRDFESGRSPQRVVSLAVAVIVALLFGASGFTSGYLLGSAKPEQRTAAARLDAKPQVADVPQPAIPPPPPPPPVAEQAPVSDPVGDLEAPRTRASGDDKAKKGAERKAETVSAAQEVSAQSETGGGSDSLSGLSLAAGPGPVAGSAGGNSVSGGTGLEASAIQSTVQKNQNAVKRSCWQPALNNRSADAPSTARVTTTIQIAPNGSVTHVKHSGDPRGYPGLGACIVTRLKGWTFPKSNGSTTANIPFVFAAQ